jgi:hypothetical protein
MSFYKNLTNSFTYFIEDEALLNASGSVCYLFIPAFYENMIDVDFKDLISNLKIMDPADKLFTEFSEFINCFTDINMDNDELLGKHIRQPNGDIHKLEQQIIDDMEYIERIGSKFYTKGMEKHAISIIIHYRASSFDVHIANNGFMSNSHHSKGGDNFLRESVITVTNISKQKLKYFLFFIHLANTWKILYNVAFSLLYDQDLYYDNNISHKLLSNFTSTSKVDIDAEKKKEIPDIHISENYFEPQLTGSCVNRTLFHAVYIFFCKIYKVEKSTFLDFMLVFKLHCYKKFLDGLLTVLNNQLTITSVTPNIIVSIEDVKYKFINSSIEFSNPDAPQAPIDLRTSYSKLNLTYQFFREKYRNKNEIYFTDNIHFVNLLDEIIDIENEIDSYFNYAKPIIINTIQDNPNSFRYPSEAKIDEKIPFSRLIHPRLVAPNTDHLKFDIFLNYYDGPLGVLQANSTKEYLPCYKLQNTDKTIHEFNKFNQLEDFIKNINNAFNSRNQARPSLFATSFTSIIYDLNNIIKIFKDKDSEIFNKIDDDTNALNVDHLLLLHTINQYLKNIVGSENKYCIDDPNLPAYELEITKYFNELNKKYSNMKIINMHAYNQFKNSYNELINDFYLHFLIEPDRLIKHIFNILVVDNTKTTTTNIQETFGPKPSNQQKTIDDIIKSINIENIQNILVPNYGQTIFKSNSKKTPLSGPGSGLVNSTDQIICSIRKLIFKNIAEIDDKITFKLRYFLLKYKNKLADLTNFTDLKILESYLDFCMDYRVNDWNVGAHGWGDGAISDIDKPPGETFDTSLITFIETSFWKVDRDPANKANHIRRDLKDVISEFVADCIINTRQEYDNNNNTISYNIGYINQEGLAKEYPDPSKLDYQADDHMILINNNIFQHMPIKDQIPIPTSTTKLSKALHPFKINEQNTVPDAAHNFNIANVFSPSLGDAALRTNLGTKNIFIQVPSAAAAAAASS